MAMKKRFHQGAQGMYAQEMYADMDSRRREEARDGDMIREDRSAVANLPQSVVYREYHKDGYNMPESLDDSIRGIDKQMDELDGGPLRKHLDPKKY